jgi:putative ABC transport system substrate-binding protein
MQMQRTTVGLLVLLAFGGLFVSLATEAQAPAHVHRIGRLSGWSPTPDPNVEALRQHLRDLGYVEGHNLVLELRYAEGRAERLPDLAAELVQLQVEVIVAEGAAAIRAAQQATRTIPIVMSATSDPVGQGFVASLAHPGGNITGLSFLSADLPGKRLEILKETLPQSRRIAVLVNPAHPYYEPLMHNLTEAARVLGLDLHVVEVHRADELATAFAAMPRAGMDAVLVLEDAVLLNSQLGRVVADLAAQSRLPVMYGWKAWVVAGCFISYGPDQFDIIKRTLPTWTRSCTVPHQPTCPSSGPPSLS